MSLRNLLTSSPVQTLLVCAPALLLNACHTPHYTRVGSVSATPDNQQIRSIDVDLGVADIRVANGPLRVTANLLARDGVADEIMPTQRFEDHVQMDVVGGVLQIRSVHEDGDDWRIDLDLQVPDSSDLLIRNAVGDVSGELGDLRGLTATVGVGDIDLTVASVSERLVVGTGVGDTDLVLLQDVPPEMALETGVGDLDVKLPETVDVSIQADSGIGDIDLKRGLAPNARRSNAAVKIGTGTGDIRVR